MQTPGHPDRIEAGTYVLAGAITGGELTIEGINAAHMGSFLDLLKTAGLNLDYQNQSIKISDNLNLNPLEVVTYPSRLPY